MDLRNKMDDLVSKFNNLTKENGELKTKVNGMEKKVTQQASILTELQQASASNVAKMKALVRACDNQTTMLRDFTSSAKPATSTEQVLPGRKRAKAPPPPTTEELSKAVLRNCEDGLREIVCPIKGRSVVADKVFPKGAFVVEYRGELIDLATARRREDQYAEEGAGCYLYYFEFSGRRYCVDATAETAHLGRLVNHSAMKPNLTTRAISVHGKPRLVLVAGKSISVGEELLFHYGDRSRHAIAANPWLTTS